MDKSVILMCFVWMIYEFGQGLCVCMLTCSIDNFYGFLETLEMGFLLDLLTCFMNFYA